MSEEVEEERPEAPTPTGAVARMLSLIDSTMTATGAFRKANSVVPLRADKPDVVDETVEVCGSVAAAVSAVTWLARRPARGLGSDSADHPGATDNHLLAAVPGGPAEDVDTTVLHGCAEDPISPVEAHRRGHKAGVSSGANRDHLGLEASVRPVVEVFLAARPGYVTERTVCGQVDFPKGRASADCGLSRIRPIPIRRNPQGPSNPNQQALHSRLRLHRQTDRSF